MKKTKQIANKLLWLDLEMTGLDPQLDVILEAGVIMTDWDFNQIEVFESAVRAEPDLIEKRMEVSQDFWNQNPQAKSDILKQNETAPSLDQVEARILKVIDKYIKKNEFIILAGNSIHQDRRFIDNYWPKLSARLHYRMLDVSAWKVVFETKYNMKFVKPENHRALSDINGSIEELKYYLNYINKNHDS